MIIFFSFLLSLSNARTLSTHDNAGMMLCLTHLEHPPSLQNRKQKGGGRFFSCSLVKRRKRTRECECGRFFFQPLTTKKTKKTKNMESFRPTAPGAGAAGSCGCGTRCPALIGGSCLCGCTCLLDSRDARRLLAERIEREERDHCASKKKQRHSASLKDDDDAAAAQALTALSGREDRDEHAAALHPAGKKGGCCGGGGGQAVSPPFIEPAAAAGGGGEAEILQLDADEDARDAELEGIAAVVAAAVGAPLAGEPALGRRAIEPKTRARKELKKKKKPIREPDLLYLVRLARRGEADNSFPSSPFVAAAVPYPFLSNFVLLLSLPKKPQSSSPSTRGRASLAGSGALAGGGRARPPRWSLLLVVVVVVAALLLPPPPPRLPPLLLLLLRATTPRSGRPAPPSARRSSKGSPRGPWSSGTRIWGSLSRREGLGLMAEAEAEER